MDRFFKIVAVFLTILCANLFAKQDFLSQQKEYSRVRAAIADKGSTIVENLRKFGLTSDNFHILIAAYKAEGELEVYAKATDKTKYIKLAAYDICASSGKLGPKRKQGDRQVPEGFYKIDRFNPSSNFYLSLGINYPNEADRKKSVASNFGGDIFIHGSCVTVGCLPMTDDKIKEIYLYAVNARNNGQKNIPVYIFPFKMSEENFQKYQKQYNDDKTIIDFWTNLKIGYDKFISEQKALDITIDKSGNYLF